MATMSETLPFRPLALNLPSTRMSVDFSTIATDFEAISIAPTEHKQPLRRNYPGVHPQPALLPEVQEESEPINAVPSRQDSLRWPWKKPHSVRSGITLSRTGSSASTASTATASTAVSSISSRALSTSTARTSTSLGRSDLDDPLPSTGRISRLEKLPFSVLENIVAHLLLPLSVTIGPQDPETRHIQHRYHPSGLDYVDIHLILKQPIFLISRHMREVALDVFYRRCDFVIDLHKIYHTKVFSTINENLKKHQKYWLYDTPDIVRASLSRISRLHIRLPVPSTEAGRRGREEDDWMDGSDGKGGGSWKVKSIKKETEDAFEVQICLESIKELVLRQHTKEPGRAYGFGRMPSIRRTKSFRTVRSNSPEAGLVGYKRTPLKRLEIVLVKRASSATVLPETLALIRTLKAIPVSGFKRYHFELEGQKVLWATKYRNKWQGLEPDGPKLLSALQALTIAERPIEPICTPTEVQFAKFGKQGRLQRSKSAMPPIAVVLETSTLAEKALPIISSTSPTSKPVRHNTLPWPRKKSRQRVDSFALVMDEGVTRSGRDDQPPTVEELRKIADDIRNGVY
ncbi:hypothetical protein BDV95DRAFT_205163 [Massariosphaeria phaeospora]|uniref:F-box domain-containing protein n=1 Tax=Massariosphaeria phaeospora TaxID=100035 RepID=A0A7C8M325_9PLEO|nr:hypothetical protein BDV95DRAFT_205163 [Massariosphaeria phaeospora]